MPAPSLAPVCCLALRLALDSNRVVSHKVWGRSPCRTGCSNPLAQEMSPGFQFLWLSGLLHPTRLMMEPDSACPGHGKGMWVSLGPQPLWGNLAGDNCICSVAENNKLLSERRL